MNTNDERGYEATDEQMVLNHLNFMLGGAEHAVREEGERVKGIVDRVLDGMARGRTINSLGELQSYGPMFDAACARLATIRQALEFTAKQFGLEDAIQ